MMIHHGPFLKEQALLHLISPFSEALEVFGKFTWPHSATTKVFALRRCMCYTTTQSAWFSEGTTEALSQIGLTTSYKARRSNSCDPLPRDVYINPVDLTKSEKCR